jgi:hypothetical protein
MAKTLEAGGVETSREPPGQPKVATAAACLPAWTVISPSPIPSSQFRRRERKRSGPERQRKSSTWTTVQHSTASSERTPPPPPPHPFCLSLSPSRCCAQTCDSRLDCSLLLPTTRRPTTTTTRENHTPTPTTPTPIPSHPLYCAPSPRTPCFLHSAPPGWIYARHRVVTTTTTTTTDHYHSRVSPRPSTITTANAGIEAFDPVAGQPPSPSLHADARDHVDLRARYTRMTSISAYRRQHQ